MRAIACYSYGPPELLQLIETPKPVPSKDDILVKVNAVTVTPSDCEMRRFDMHVLFWLPVRLLMGIIKPNKPILGFEFAGEVEAVGVQIENFKKGDLILGSTGLNLGCYAEYACIRNKDLKALKPSKLSFEEVATLPVAGINALHYIRKADIKPGQKILIIGAAGCFGSYAVQLAKHFGAEVTAVDSIEKLAMLVSIGADHVIDYTQEDFTKNGETYDAIYDIPGKGSVIKYMKSLTLNGRYVLSNPWVKQVLQGMWGSITSKRKFFIALASERPEDLSYLAELMVAGKLKAVIDKTYSLQEMQVAHMYVESGKKIGNVVINMN